MKKAVNNLTARKYPTAVNCLSKDSRFDKAINKMIYKRIKKECEKLSADPRMKIYSAEDLQNFNVLDVYNTAEELCPTTLTALRAITHRSQPRAIDNSKFKISAAIGILLNEKNRSCNAVQKLMGILMYKKNLITEVRVFNFSSTHQKDLKLGLCLDIDDIT